jgi:hypothetical protein
VLSTACPEGTATCNDVTGVSGVLVLFPLAIVLAFLCAWPLTRFLLRQGWFGWPLAIFGAAVYLTFANSTTPWSPLGFVLSVIGIGLARGRTTAQAHAP